MEKKQAQSKDKPQEIAATLGVSVGTLSRWRAAGCPCMESKPYGRGKQASRPRYNLEQVKAWINEQRKGKEVQS